MMKFFKGISSGIRNIVSEKRESPNEDAIVFTKDIDIKPITAVEVKVGEFAAFLSLAVKYGNREIIAIGTGEYFAEQRLVRINSIYTVLDAPGSSASVSLTVDVHRRLDKTLEHNNEQDELAVLHTHPGFSANKSGIDDGHGIRISTLLFGGKAVMVIVDPFSAQGVETSAYAVDPKTKNVVKIPLRLVA